MERQYDLEERTIAFAVQVLELVALLPNNYEGMYFMKQLTRSGNSPALNYAEARVAESKRDFFHKMKICLKELKETQVSLKIIARRGHLPVERLAPVQQECGELVAIFLTSVNKERKKLKHLPLILWTTISGLIQVFLPGSEWTSNF